MSVDIYKWADRNRLRFPSIRGLLSAEQLFMLPLKSQEGFDLDTIAREVNSQLKSVTEESFVEEAKPDPRKKGLEISLEILKDVIKTKQDENQAAINKAHKAAQRKKILDAISAKDDAALTTATKEDLEKQLAALEDE